MARSLRWTAMAWFLALIAVRVRVWPPSLSVCFCFCFFGFFCLFAATPASVDGIDREVLFTPAADRPGFWGISVEGIVRIAEGIVRGFSRKGRWGV
jgi:hypothetical protein